jgi:hypothetical protein
LKIEKLRTIYHNIRIYLIITAFIGLQFALNGQEILSGLEINPVVKQKFLEQGWLKSTINGLDTIPMTVPFFDDFQDQTVFPDQERWIDRYAFVNTDIPIYPVNLGAVTLDAISDSGQMYPDAIPGPDTFLADKLTSRFIRLDSVFEPAPRALSPADSVYLSFWYQPQGRGKPPHPADSLKLRFLVKPEYDSISPTDTTHIEAQWEDIWGSEGMALDTFYLKNNTYFVLVMIPIIDSQYFKRQFRFQFYNYVSLASSAEPSWQSNCSQWNIDEVYLNIGRNIGDTIRPQLSFVERPPSMLKKYSAMPYPQYSDNPTNEMADTIDILISNRDINNHNSSYSYVMRTPSGSWEKEYMGGQYVIKPFYQAGFVTYVPFAHPPVQYLFPIATSDSALFEVEHRVTAEDGSNLADTMVANQVFYNYYAYDDGTPDAGYGLTPANSKLAYRFKINKLPDTLRAIQFYFNRTLSGNNVQFFYLTVWNDNNNKPGEVLYEELVRPKFADSLNQFVTYHLDPPLRLSTTFYVGWEQTTDDNLNVGYDRYNNRNSEILYNVMGTWENSAFLGSLMIRPIVGKPIPLGIPPQNATPTKLKLFPNPASTDVIKIEPPERVDLSEKLVVRIYNLYGQNLMEVPYSETIRVSGLPSGMYLVTLTGDAGSHLATGRLIIAR